MDRINAVFELVGAFLAWRSVLELQRTKTAKGVYLPMIAFSGAWAVECLPYYLSHDDGLSAAAAVFRCAGLLTWSVMAVRSRP